MPDARFAPIVQDLVVAIGEQGDRLVVTGIVRDVEGDTIADAVLDFWQADAQGRYSGFDPGPPDMNLRGRLRSQRDGSHQLHTVRPAACTIPHGANAVRDDLVRPVTRTGSGYSLDFDVLLEPEPTPAG
jgi:catechol 1,2-dioxygenase